MIGDHKKSMVKPKTYFFTGSQHCGWARDPKS